MNRAHRVGEIDVSAFHARHCENLVLADNIVRVLLAVGRHVAVIEVVTGQTLVAGEPSASENREREARKPNHADLVGS